MRAQAGMPKCGGTHGCLESSVFQVAAARRLSTDRQTRPHRHPEDLLRSRTSGLQRLVCGSVPPCRSRSGLVFHWQPSYPQAGGANTGELPVQLSVCITNYT